MGLILDKKGFEISFAWLFSLIIGAVILFFAIFLAFSLIGTEEYRYNTEVAREFSILFDPLETKLATGFTDIAEMPEEIKLYNTCEATGNFGRNIFTISHKGFGDKWSDVGAEIPITNKYVFSDKAQGDIFHIFLKPFEMGFKVSDLIFVYSEPYCFVNPPSNIQNELSDIGISNNTNILVTSSTSEECINVCFSGSCDITIVCDDSECSSGYVSKYGETVRFIGNLLYGAVFSDPGLYKCNVDRLMLRLKQLSLVYLEKSYIVSLVDCNTGLSNDLNILASLIDSDGYDNLDVINAQATILEQRNEALACQLFED